MNSVVGSQSVGSFRSPVVDGGSVFDNPFEQRAGGLDGFANMVVESQLIAAHQILESLDRALGKAIGLAFAHSALLWNGLGDLALEASCLMAASKVVRKEASWSDR